jgi:hypothetical protein
MIAAKASRTRVRGYAGWKPQAKSLVLLGQVQAILIEYHDHLPLTARQIFYRLVGAHGYPKAETAYDRLCEMLNRARRCGRIPWEHIRDDGTVRRDPHCYQDTDELLRTFAAEVNRFRLDRQDGQPVRLLFAVEAGGMVPQVERIAAAYGISVMSSGGFDSVTAKHELAGAAKEWPAIEVLHIGDHDPSGVHMFSALAEDVRAFVGSGHDIRFTRLAVTPEQMEELRLPTAPPKKTDRRAFRGQTAQAEAIAPSIMAGIIRDAINSRIDHAIRADVLQEEEAAKEALSPVLQAITDRAP